MHPLVPSTQALRALRAQAAPYLCQDCARRAACFRRNAWQRAKHTEAGPPKPHPQVPIRARPQWKAVTGPKHKSTSINFGLAEWDLTVGIEVHAELSTTCKLFSPAGTTVTSPPNTHAALFDTAIPGAQPQFQKEVLLPALRAALSLSCDIRERSGWDRKHYFWWDQPQGYQITQYYQPFASNGQLILCPWDDIDPKDATNDEGEIHIGIKQVQLEQDTAKTVLQPPENYLLDFNRAGVPLVEIITRPEIKSPKTAAAVVKKIQALLQSVGANSTGMEMGGLRADVNVSVRRRDEQGTAEYDGVTGLGQRTEIKNLSSFKAVEDAIVAERDRQISVLENGGAIEGETRGWTLGATTTRRLRGKEGEVDYRYMPDPDLEPLTIGHDLVDHVRATLPYTPTQIVKALMAKGENQQFADGNPLRGPHGLSVKDARTLVSLDDGERLEFYLSTLHDVHDLLAVDERSPHIRREQVAKAVCNWALMELPTYLSSANQDFPYQYSMSTDGEMSSQDASNGVPLSSPVIASLVYFILRGYITQQSARKLLKELSIPQNTEHDVSVQERNIAGDEHIKQAKDRVSALIEQHNLWFTPMPLEELRQLARNVVLSSPGMATKARDEVTKTQGRKRGKMMWFVGQMIQTAEEGTIDAKDAERYVYDALVAESAAESETESGRGD